MRHSPESKGLALGALRGTQFFAVFKQVRVRVAEGVLEGHHSTQSDADKAIWERRFYFIIFDLIIFVLNFNLKIRLFTCIYIEVNIESVQRANRYLILIAVEFFANKCL